MTIATVIFVMVRYDEWVRHSRITSSADHPKRKRKKPQSPPERPSKGAVAAKVIINLHLIIYLFYLTYLTIYAGMLY